MGGRLGGAAILLLALSLPASAAENGVVLETRTIDRRAGKGSFPGQIQVQGKSLRIDLPALPRSGGRSSLLFDGAQERVWILLHGQKQFIEIDRATAEASAKQIEAARAQIQEQLAKLPAKQRARMESMLGRRGLSPIPPSGNSSLTAADTGKTETVDGKSCREVRLSAGGDEVGDACIADWSSVGLSAADFEGFKELARFQAGLLGMRAHPAGGAAEQSVELWTVLSGFPLRTRSLEREKVVRETTYTNVKRAELAGDIFRPPGDYKRTTLPPQRSVGAQ